LPPCANVARLATIATARRPDSSDVANRANQSENGCHRWRLTIAKMGTKQLLGRVSLIVGSLSCVSRRGPFNLASSMFGNPPPVALFIIAFIRAKGPFVAVHFTNRSQFEFRLPKTIRARESGTQWREKHPSCRAVGPDQFGVAIRH